MKVHKREINGRHFEFWYDPSYRCWYCAEFDSAHNQIGAAQDSYTKDEIISQIDDYLVPVHIEDGLIAKCSKCDKWINPERAHIVHDKTAEPPGFLQLCDECAEPHLVACYCRGPKHPPLWTTDCSTCKEGE